MTRQCLLGLKAFSNQGRDFLSCSVVQSPYECPRCDLWLKRSATKVSAQVVFTPMQSAQPYNPTSGYAQFFHMKTPKPPTERHEKNSPD